MPRSIKLSPGPNITQQDVLSLPSPQAPIVNPSATLAIWPVSTYDVDEYRTDKSFYLIDLRKQSEGEQASPRLLKSGLDNFEAAWLDDSTVVFLRPVQPSDFKVSIDAQGRRVDQTDETNDEDYAKLKESWKEKEDGTEIWTLDVDGSGEEKIGKLPVS